MYLRPIKACYQSRVEGTSTIGPRLHPCLLVFTSTNRSHIVLSPRCLLSAGPNHRQSMNRKFTNIVLWRRYIAMLAFLQEWLRAWKGGGGIPVLLSRISIAVRGGLNDVIIGYKLPKSVPSGNVLSVCTFPHISSFAPLPVIIFHGYKKAC